tara:strand:+ start:74 stop:1288 length:1215 start_codon:yes stop_codon:yes gene_type:complete
LENLINKNISILLVDDEPFILNLTSKILNNLGYENIKTAQDGNSALLKLVTSNSPFDLIICDMNMPEMDGIEFMRRANEAKYSGGFILLSGEDVRLLEIAYSYAKTQNLNILGAIPKPLNPKVLEGMLNSLAAPKERTQFSTAEIAIDEDELRRGIRNQNSDKLLVLYQPKIEVSTGNIIGVEALARWNHGARGILAPVTFLPLAEQAGLMEELTRKIYEKVVSQMNEWHKSGINLIASINFPASSFEDPKLIEYLIAVCKESDVSSSQIVLEISEAEAMRKSAFLVEVLMRLRLKRFDISIDKFGSENMSISALKDMPVTELKVDKAFVSGAVDNSGGRATLEASVALAKNLNMKVVAVGVEEKEHWNLVVELGVDYVQGYFLSKPLSGNEITELARNWTGPH